MPWTHSDASGFTKAADTPHKQRQWSLVANSILEHTQNEGAAVRGANSVIRHLTDQETAAPAPSKSNLGVGMRPHAPQKKK